MYSYGVIIKQQYIDWVTSDIWDMVMVRARGDLRENLLLVYSHGGCLFDVSYPG